MVNKEFLPKLQNILEELNRYNLENLPVQEGWTEKTTKKVIESMKECILLNKPLDERLIRAFKDVAVISVRNYENTKLGAAINSLSECLSNNITNYTSYKPLGMDFGKGEPF